MTLTYLIGKQYRETKLSEGRNWLLHQNDAARTSSIIGKSSGVGSATVERAAVFSENLEKICENAGIKRQEILLGNIEATMKDVNVLAEYEEPEIHSKQSLG